MPVRRRLSIAADAGAPRAARAELRAVDGLDANRRRVAELLVSELVTNAVLHAGLAADDRVEITISAGPPLRVDVVDHARGDAAAPGDPDRDGGRGLLLVEALASRWGLVRGDGTRAWFELDVSRNGA